MSLTRSTFYLFVTFAALLVPGGLRADNLPLTHPTANFVKEYLTAVVNQDWAKAGSMLAEPSLRKKLDETVAIIQNAPTMTDEAAMLARLGVRDLSELKEMSPAAFYAAERAAVHQRLNVDPAVMERKKETLSIQVIGLAGEDGDRNVHAVVRTSQETLKEKIQELFLISLERVDGDTKRWLIVPDMMRPVSERLPETP